MEQAQEPTPTTGYSAPVPEVNHERLYMGWNANCVPDLLATLGHAFSQGFDFCAVPLMHPRFDRMKDYSSEMALTRSDLLLTGEQWSTQIVGKISTWIELDSHEEDFRRSSEDAFKQEMAWATHLSISSVLLPCPSSMSVNYARCVNAFLSSPHIYTKVWIRVPLTYKERKYADMNDNIEEIRSPWEDWNTLRILCAHNTNLTACLEITEDLPDISIMEKWFGEPVSCIIVPTSIFITNRGGFPVLSRAHQDLVTNLFAFKVQVIVSGQPSHAQGVVPYVKYLQYLQSRRPAKSEAETFCETYNDYLQAPLQPLMDNLESQTYEVFEKDPVKYRLYEEAVYSALCDRTEPDSTTTLMVVGAGRGPLVRASLRAADRANRMLRIYAVEKNQNAVITLHNLKQSLGWGDAVTIVSSDMRDWKAPEKADILVSELLGSWGDNELSPECLDGAQRFLKDDGISIPADYTSYVAPIQSSKLYNEVKNWNDREHFETSYVVRLNNVFALAAPQPCFKFSHPNTSSTIDNSRFTTLEWKASTSSMLHGFAGYFESTLYNDIKLSILPSTHSPGMFSWFPLFIPLAGPVYVPSEAKIEASFWRKTTKNKVWYEWTLTSPRALPIANPNGRSHWIGL